MKSIVLALALGLVACAPAQTPPQARVVRLMASTNSAQLRLSVDGEKSASLSSQEVTNRLTKLRLHQGDLILLGNLPDYESSPLAATWKWLKSCCESNRVAVYIYGATAPRAAAELFTIPVYNWSAPYDDPLSLERASFFHEGRFLGAATNGFESMLDDISRSRPQKVFILGSLYDIYRSFPPTPAPYEHQRDRLDAVLKSAGTETIELDVDLRF